MKKIFSAIALSSLMLSISGMSFAATSSMKPMTSSSISSSHAKDLVPGCVVTQHNYKVCGYFFRGVLQKLPRAAHKDIFFWGGFGGF